MTAGYAPSFSSTCPITQPAGRRLTEQEEGTSRDATAAGKAQLKAQHEALKAQLTAVQAEVAELRRVVVALHHPEAEAH